MRPRIFINIHYLEIGGAESSLIGLLQSMDPERVEVELFLNDHRGEMMKYIPAWVKVLPECKEYTMIERPVAEAVKAGCLRVAAARLWAKLRFRLYAMRKRPSDGSAIFGYVGKYVTRVLPSLARLGEYDLAVSFVAPHDIVLDKVRAKKKICWIHTDYSRIDVDAALELPVWSGYDYIASVSDDVTRCFCQVFPSLREKTVVIENILSPAFIRSRAAGPRPDDMPPTEGGPILLTIGRYSYPKRLEDIPSICRRLRERGIALKWYIIGYGGSDGHIRAAISREGVEDAVILLGKKENPYPYIASCDWYVQPSRYEGKSVCVREAQILGKPVIVTAYPTAASQVRDGVDGVIVPMATDACAEAVCEVLRNTALRDDLAGNIARCDYGNEGEIDKIYALIKRAD